MRCQRGDDIWVNDHVLDDVINLIWRAQIVIADLTIRNPNVFYEAGIAHTLGRDVIQIVQSTDDIPFDLQAIRSVAYQNNPEGLRRLPPGRPGRSRVQPVMLFIKHSCEPNVGFAGSTVLTAMRDIHAGEELTTDYALFDDHDQTMECRCGTPSCRGTVSGRDWQRPDLQRKYGDYFSSYLLRRLARQPDHQRDG